VIPVTEATPQPELPAFITGPIPVAVMDAPAPAAAETAKPKRAPRKPKVDAPSEPSA
jgi:hypothetical protein